MNSLSNAPLIRPVLYSGLLAATVILASTARADQTKANNVTALINGGSWVSGVVPGAGDMAIFDNTYQQVGAVPINGNATWLGLRVLNPGNNVDITALNCPGPVLLTGGIDMSAATANVTINCVNDFTVGLNGTTTAMPWNVASNLTLTLYGKIWPAPLNGPVSELQVTKLGGGTVVMGAPNGGANNPNSNPSWGTNGFLKISAGTVQALHAYILGNNAGPLSNLILDGGTFQYGGSFTVMPWPVFLTTNSGSTIDTMANSVTMSNILQNYTTAGSFTKIGSGTLTLAATNIYSGATTISAGTLALGGSGTISNSANIFVANGAMFDVSAASFTLNNGQTLGGGGVVTGAVTVAAGGTLAPGSSTSTLSFSNALTLNAGSTNLFAFNPGAAANAQMAVVGNLTPNNSQILIDLGGQTLGVGTYTLINYAGTMGNTFNSTVLTQNGSLGGLPLLDESTAGVIKLDVVPNVSVAGLYFSQQPASAQAGAIIAPNVVVTSTNSGGIPVQGALVAMSVGSGSGTLSGNLYQLTDVNGNATFTNLIFTAAGAKQLQAMVSTYATNLSAPFSITAASPATVSILVQPSAAASAGALFATQPVVAIEDGYGNVVSNSTAQIVASASSGALHGTTTQNAVDGTVAFTDLYATPAGDIYLSFAASGLAATNSENILVSGTAMNLVVTLPGQTFNNGSGNDGTVTAQTAGTAFNLTLTAVDVNGNAAISYSGVKTISYSGPDGSPTYTTSVNFNNGQATGVATTLNQAETTTITATGGSLAGVRSSFLVVNPVGSTGRVKANNTTSLNQTGSWVGGVEPTAIDQGIWNGTVTAANTVALGADANWGGIQILNPGGMVTITSGNTLGLGSSGIDMSEAGQSLWLADAVTLDTNQTWVVTNGQTLTAQGTIGGTGALITDGAGTIVLGATNSYTGATTIKNGTLQLGIIASASVAAPTPVANWMADDLAAVGNGNPVTSWSDDIANLQVTTGNAAPTLKTGANGINGHCVVNFNGTSQNLTGTAANDPVAGLGNFSIVVVFRPQAPGIGTDANGWFSCSGLIDGDIPNTQRDWGFAWNSASHVVAGLGGLDGGVDTSIHSTTALANNTAHVAVYTRSGGTLNLYVDNGVPVTGNGGGTDTRVADTFDFGKVVTGATSWYNGDIAQIQVYNTELSAAQVAVVSATLGTNYGILPPTSTVGVIDSTANVSVNNGATLSGNGMIAGPVTVNAGGTLAPGASVIGALTINNSLTLSGTTLLKLNKSLSPSNDVVVVTGALGYGGTLVVNNEGPGLILGDSFNVFNVSGSPSGNFASITPAPGAGLSWSFTPASGLLSVVSGTVSSQPVITGVEVAGGNVVLSGTNGEPSTGFSVLSSTNVTLPLAEWSVITNGTFNSQGAFDITNLVNPAELRRFYRLSVP